MRQKHIIIHLGLALFLMDQVDSNQGASPLPSAEQLPSELLPEPEEEEIIELEIFVEEEIIELETFVEEEIIELETFVLPVPDADGLSSQPLPTEEREEPSEPSEVFGCTDDASWDAGWGGCDTYAVGNDNHQFCGEHNDGHRIAQDACPKACESPLCVVVRDPPHIVFILVDDLGWRDVGFHGAEFPTPNIDMLANSGVLLNNYYVHPLCSPTRAAILTGRQPLELGLHSVFKDLQELSLNYGGKFLGEMLQMSGYYTALVGKWHLGYTSWDDTPTGCGFDYFFGLHGGYFEHFTHDSRLNKLVDSDLICGQEHGSITYFEQYAPDANFDFMGYDLFENKESVGFTYHGNYSTDLFTYKATTKIKEHSERAREGEKLFLYVAYDAVHDPWQAPLKAVESTECFASRALSEERGILCGMAQSLDEGIGKIYETLQEEGYLENTLIIFSSDNGADVTSETIRENPAGSNYPLRNGKRNYFEGGTKSIGFVWGNPVRAGTYHDGQITSPSSPFANSYDHLMQDADWFLTLQHFAGLTVESELKSLTQGLNSSFDFYDSLTTQSADGPRDKLVYHIGWPTRRNEGAVRNSKFKLLKGADSLSLDGWFDYSTNNHEVLCSSSKQCKREIDDTLFFNIKDDPQERNPLNIKKLNAEEQLNYDELESYWQDWNADVKSPDKLGDDTLLFAGGLPHLWTCHFHPWISTSRHPINIIHNCTDGQPDDIEEVCQGSCGDSCWVTWASLP